MVPNYDMKQLITKMDVKPYRQLKPGSLAADKVIRGDWNERLLIRE